MRRSAVALSLVLLAACAEPDETTMACDDEPLVRTTEAGVEYVRTPDACFEGLPDWPYEARYVAIDGLRQGYAEAGPADGPVVLLLHGQPSWSYLYRTMIPVLADAGYRVIAMDHLGMGRSDKPTDLDAYSYLGHNERLEAFIEQLGLRDIHLFVQDWGSLIGLRVAGLHPDWFAAIAVGDGMLPVLPEGFEPFEEPADPDVPAGVEPPYAGLPDQQVPFYDGCTPLGDGDPQGGFGDWIAYAMTEPSFRPSETIEALTWFPLSPEVEAAYDAPFPSREYMGGPRTFPSLVNELGGTTQEAWDNLGQYERPFITIWAANDPGNLGACETQQALVDHVPGAAGYPHVRLDEASHFLQEDQGPQIAQRLVALFDLVPLTRGRRYCEVLLLNFVDGGAEANVWGTQGVSDCPEAGFATLDADAIAEDNGVVAAVINGPRRWLPDGGDATLPSNERRWFGDLEMLELATVLLTADQIADTANRQPYQETVVERTTTYYFDEGSEIYELTAPDGAVYVMQSMSMEIDPDLSLDDLAGLGSRLELPAGWTYAATVLDAAEELDVPVQAVVLQDDLQNTYQRR